MEISNFIEYIINKKRSISNHSQLGWPWLIYYEYAELTNLIDFKCDFDKEGVCKNRRPYRNIDNLDINSKCCCGSCAITIGHSRTFPNNMLALKEIAKLFDIHTGFWRRNVGCVLPRKYRSVTCLKYICSDGHNDITPSDILLRMINTEWQAERMYGPQIDYKPPEFFTMYDWVKPIRMYWISAKTLKEMLLKERNGVENIRLPIIKNNLTGHSKCRPQ